MKHYFYKYITPKEFDNLLMISDGKYLTVLYFEKSNDEHKHEKNYELKQLPIFKKTTEWLDTFLMVIFQRLLHQ